MTAQPKYIVMLKVCIGKYEGDWDGNEVKYDDQITEITETPSREYAEAVYKGLGGKLSGVAGGE